MKLLDEVRKGNKRVEDLAESLQNKSAEVIKEEEKSKIQLNH